MKDALILKNRLKEARTEKKLSQSALAQLVVVYTPGQIQIVLLELGEVCGEGNVTGADCVICGGHHCADGQFVVLDQFLVHRQQVKRFGL